MVATSRPASSATTVAATTASNEAGSERCRRGVITITAATNSTRPRAAAVSAGERVTQGAEGDDGGVLPLRTLDAEGGGHLLQEDDHGDAEGEALDDRPRHVGEVATEPEHPGGEDHHPGQHADDHDGVGAVPGDERDEHHGHGPGRPGDLYVRAPQEAGHQAGHDRGGQPGGRAEPGGDAEGQRQGQGDDGDGQAGDDVVLPGSGEAPVVGPPGQEALHRVSSARPARRSWVSRREVSNRALAVARRSTTSGSLMA